MGVVGGVLVPLGAYQTVEVVVVDGLLFVAANGVDEFDQFAVEDGGRCLDQLFLGLLALGVAGVAADGQAGQF